MRTKTFPSAVSENLRFTKTGEFRNPRKGEFFLSGAIAEVYFAPSDLSTAYHIMQPVKKTTHQEIKTAVLSKIKKAGFRTGNIEIFSPDEEGE